MCAFINTQKNCVHQPNLTCKILQTLQKNHYQKNNSQGLNTNTWEDGGMFQSNTKVVRLWFVHTLKITEVFFNQKINSQRFDPC